MWGASTFGEVSEPEDRLKEGVGTRATATTRISMGVLRDLTEICTKYGGTLASTVSPITPSPERPPETVEPEVKARVVSLLKLKSSPSDDIKELGDFVKLGRDEQIRVCTSILGDVMEIDVMKIVDPEVGKLYYSHLDRAKTVVALARGKPVRELVGEELREAQRIAREETFLSLCRGKLEKYFELLANPDMLATHTEPKLGGKPVGRITCTQHNPDWNDMILAMARTCSTAREHILERGESLCFAVEANFNEPSRPLVQVTDKACADVGGPRRIPSHRVTMRMVIDAKIRVPKEKMKDAVKHLLDMPGTLSIKTDKDLEREIILTLFKRLKYRLEDMLRASCTPYVQEEMMSLSPHKVKSFKGVADAIEARKAQLRTLMPRGTPEKEVEARAREEVKRELARIAEEALTPLDEELRRLLAKRIAHATAQMAERALFEVLPVQPVCPPKVTVDITRGKERPTIPIPTRAWYWHRIAEEVKALDIEIDVDQIEVKIEFCTPWCSAIACVLSRITPDYVIEELLRRAKELGFAEVKL
jgi:hypothetical protein